MSGGGVIDSAAPPRRRASGTQRLADGVALALMVGGVGLFFYARYRLQLLAAHQITRVQGHRAVEQFMHYCRLPTRG